MSEVAAALDDLDEAVARYRRRRMNRFPTDTLLWLGALPEWTDRLATDVGFPPDASPLAELLDGLDAAGLLARRDDIDVDGEEVVAFWLPASRRAEVGELLRDTVPAKDLARRLEVLAHRLRALPAERREELDPWLALVDQHRADASGAALLSQVDGLVTRSRTTEALSLVGAAQALADLLGEPLSSSARRAQWRIDRSYREALDARSLRHHLPRDDVDAALRGLLQAPGRTWALHLLGDGGVGKTMAVRDVCSGRFARRSGMAPFPVARIDFDHLDPRYPDARPAELLAALSGELTPYNTTRHAEKWFRRTDDAVSRVHEEATAGAGSATGHPLLDDAVEAFAGYLRAFDGPVVLVLDTCEELAKLHPPGGRAPAVDQTFSLLERIHDLAPDSRVVLAGRRWLIPPPPGAAAGLLLDPRPYLRVVRVGGFTREQADAYLALRDPDARLPQPLRTALLGRSGGADNWNPFDLACYCDWALAEPGLAPEALQTDGDPYIEQRVIARLPTGAVRDCLPVAVELGRFDRGMVAPELHRRGVDVEAAFSGLVSQEWVSAVTFEPDGRAGVIEVDPNLRPRLNTVLAAQPDRFPLDRARLGRDLAAHLRDRRLDEPAVATVEAALRLLPPPEAGLLWDELERRIATTPDGWAWAGPATARAAAVETARALAEGPTILAAIHATQAAVLLRKPGGAEQAALWREVARLAPRHPDPAVGGRLTFRAWCALIEADDAAAAQRVADIWPHRPAAVDDALAAALDRMSAAPALPPSLAPAVDELCRSGDAAIAVAALLVRAAWYQAVGRTGDTLSDVEAALGRADAIAAPADRIHWLPGRLRDRARLARVVLALARSEPPDQFPLEHWRTEALDHLDDIDAERLAAATVLLEHCWSPVSLATGRHLAGADRYHPLRQQTHTWHHAVPSLCEMAATVLADAGDVSRAAAFLRTRREEAVAYGHDPATIGICDRLLVTFSRAFRTTTLTTSVHRVAREGTGAERLDAWATLALVRGESPASPEEAGGWSTWLRTQIVRPGDPPLALLESVRVEEVDHLELAALKETDQPVSGYVQYYCAVLRRRLDTSEGVIGTELGELVRTEALCGGPASPEPFCRLPPRLVAQTALAEAELLALRLPTRALRLLGLAFDRAQAAGDGLLACRAAVLHALTLARAGVDPAVLDDDERAAVRALVTQTPELFGWLVRRRLALGLIAGGLRGGSLPPSGGSPELDYRPLTGAPTRPAAVSPVWTSAAEPPAATPSAAGPSAAGPSAAAASAHVASASAASASAASVPPGEPPLLPGPWPPVLEAPTPVGFPTSAPVRRRRWPRILAWSAGVLVLGLASLVVLGWLTVKAPVQSAPANTAPVVAEPVQAPPATTAPIVTAPVQSPPVAAAPQDGKADQASETPATVQPPDTASPSEAYTEDPPPSDSSDSSALDAFLGVTLLLGSLAALVLLVRFLIGHAQFHLNRPRLTESTRAYLPGARSSTPLDVTLTTTPSEIVVRLGAARRFGRRRSRWNRPVTLLLGQRHGNLASHDPQALALAQRTEPLFVRFRQGRLPLTWRLWDDPPTSETSIGADYRGPPHLAPATTTPSRHEPDRRSVLHLVGTPVSTAAGWRLRIPAAASSTTGYQQQSRSVHVGDELVGADDLAVESTALVVLQAEPVDGPPEPLGEQYEGVCALAADIRDAGAGAVLVVPPLPDVRAATVVTQVREAVSRRHHKLHPVHVLDLAQQVKEDVISTEHGNGAVRPSRDVLLFA